jgi:Flp pilus assembly protein TadD
MKKCHVCGTKNRDRYEDCVRCGEPLVSSVNRGAGGAGLPPAIKLAIVMSVVLAAMVVGFRWMARGTSPTRAAEMENTPEAADLEPLPETDLSDLASEGEESSEEIQEATEAMRAGKAAFQAGDFQAALDHFQTLIDIAPSNSNGYLYVGLCKQKLGDLEGAKTNLREAVRLKPNEGISRQALIRLLVDSKEYGEAGELQTWFVEHDRFNPDPLVELGRIHRRQGQLDLAIEELQRAQELSAQDVGPSLELGTALSEASRTDEAISVFQKVVEEKPNDPRGPAGLGAALLRDQRYQQALAPLEKAVSLDPKGPSAHLNLAITYENLDRIEDSLREYETFVKLAPNDPSAPRVAEALERARAALSERKAQ